MNTKKLFKQITNIKQTQQPDPKFHDYHKLVKMKKLLIDTQKKMFNRIRLFQKESQKILKKKQSELRTFEKLQNIKKDPLFMNKTRTRQNIKTNQANRTRIRQAKSQQNFLKSQIGTQNESALQELQKKEIIERLNELRLQNVKIIKEDHQRNKIIIQERKKCQLRKKLQSANVIRRQRQKAKLAKEQLIKQRQSQFKKQIQGKYQKEREEFLKLQKNLQELQNAEKQALINWKKTITNN